MIRLEASCLNQIWEEVIVLTAAIEIEIEVSLLHFFLSNTDVVQGLGYRAVTEDLLEQQESPGVVIADQHLVVSEGLAESVGCYHDVKTERIGDLLQDPVDGHPAQRLVLILTVIGVAGEHVVTQVDAGGVFQVQRYSIDYGVVDCDVAVLLDFAGVAGLLLQDREAGLESKFIIDQMTEPQGEQVADSKSEIDSYDK